MPLFDLFQRSRVLTLTVSLALVLLVFFLDLLTRPDLSFSLFYVVPIALATWLAGRWSGVALSLLAALAWFLADQWSGHAIHPLISPWNTLVRLVFFLVCTFFLTGLKERRKLELERLLADRAAAEQRRIGRELHDTVMQQVLGSKILAGNLRASLQAQGAAGAEAAAELVGHLGDLALQLRRLMAGLVPVDIDPAGLVPALERIALDFRNWHGLPVHLDCDRAVGVRDSRTAHHLVGLTQEALMNAVKHARASQVVVSLCVTEQQLVLRISDDGVGLPESSRRLGGLGLQSMRHRAEVIGGTLRVAPGATRGTDVTCVLPRPAPGRLERAAPGRRPPLSSGVGHELDA